jgi:phage-related protein
MREGTEKPKYVQKPQHHDYYNDRVQNGLNRSLHGYEAVDKPKQNSHNDQDRHNG